tara:strand:+ start:453 stop:1052 length:600 start_codon:yes stop_codon:yes gene_type:complete
MNLSNKKYLTDLHYGNTNKSTIVSFDQLLSHPKYKKHIEPALMKILDIKSSDDIFMLDFENRKRIIEEINKFNFVNVPKEYSTESKSNIFFNGADCLSIKEDLIEISNDFLGENFSKRVSNDMESDYVVNHYHLTSQLGLFKYNKVNNKLDLMVKKAIVFNEEGMKEIELPKISIEIVNEKLKVHVDSKYKNKKNKLII